MGTFQDVLHNSAIFQRCLRVDSVMVADTGLHYIFQLIIRSTLVMAFVYKRLVGNI